METVNDVLADGDAVRDVAFAAIATYTIIAGLVRIQLLYQFLSLELLQFQKIDTSARFGLLEVEQAFRHQCFRWRNNNPVLAWLEFERLLVLIEIVTVY